MFNEKQIEYIKKHLRVEEFFIKNKMFNWIKEEGKNSLKEAQKISSVKHLLMDKVEGFQVKA